MNERIVASWRSMFLPMQTFTAFIVSWMRVNGQVTGTSKKDIAVNACSQGVMGAEGRQLGFTDLRITGLRLTGARPGKTVTFVFNLTEIK